MGPGVVTGMGVLSSRTDRRGAVQAFQKLFGIGPVSGEHVARKRRGGGGRRAYSFVDCLSHFTMNHALFSRRNAAGGCGERRQGRRGGGGGDLAGILC